MVEFFWSKRPERPTVVGDRWIALEIITPTQETFPVKRISVDDSRRNRARRKRKVAARHGRAGHWQAQPRPMFSPGKVHYEVGAYTDAMSYGGIGAVHRLVTKL